LARRVAFDLLGRDVRKQPLVERKEILREIVPKQSRSVLYAKHAPVRGRELFGAVCEADLEGIVAKHYAGRYGEDEPTRWLKIKNPEYSQARDRHELFERARPQKSQTSTHVASLHAPLWFQNAKGYN